jgi:hypothetical protein
MLVEPAVLRQVREMAEVSRRLSGLSIASNLERFMQGVPTSAQLPVLNIGTDVTRMSAGSSTVMAWAEAQNVHRKIAELMKPKVSIAFETPAVLTQPGTRSSSKARTGLRRRRIRSGSSSTGRCG